jgi:hypothetical protein
LTNVRWRTNHKHAGALASERGVLWDRELIGVLCAAFGGSGRQAETVTEYVKRGTPTSHCTFVAVGMAVGTARDERVALANQTQKHKEELWFGHISVRLRLHQQFTQGATGCIRYY